MSRFPRIARGLLAAAALAMFVASLAAVPAAAAPAAGVITGTVAGNGRPLAGVTVEVGSVMGITPPFFQVDASTTTRADGSYRLSGVPSSAERLQFLAGGAVGGTSATGYADLCFGGGGNCLDTGSDVTVKPGHTKTVDVSLARAGVIAGRLVDSLGRGVGGVGVQLYTGGNDQSGDSFDAVYRSTTSDVNGNYSFPQLFAHSYTLCFGGEFSYLAGTPNRDGYVGTCPPDGVGVSAGRTTQHVVVMTGGGGVAGRVVDTAGDPVVGASVDDEIYELIDPAVTTGADGRFRLGTLPPGHQQVCVSAPRYVTRCDVSAAVTSFATAQVGRIALTRES